MEPTTTKNILVPTDFSDSARRALAYGRELARSAGATLHVLHVVPIAPPWDGAEVDLAADDWPQDVDAEVQCELDAAVGGAAGIDVRTATTRALNVADAIEQYARTHDVDLIVAGTQKRNAVSRLLRGSLSDRLVRSAVCPVLTIHAEERQRPSIASLIQKSTWRRTLPTVTGPRSRL